MDERKIEDAKKRISEISEILETIDYKSTNFEKLIVERNNLAVCLETTKIPPKKKPNKISAKPVYKKKAIKVLSNKEEFIKECLAKKQQIHEIAKCLNVTPAFLEEFLILSEIPYKKIRNIKPNKLDNKVDDILLWYSQKISITEICKRCGVRRRNFVDFVESRELPITISPKPLSQEKLPKVKKYLKAGLSSEEIAFKLGIRDDILKDFYRKNGINQCDYLVFSIRNKDK